MPAALAAVLSAVVELPVGSAAPEVAVVAAVDVAVAEAALWK